MKKVSTPSFVAALPKHPLVLKGALTCAIAAANMTIGVESTAMYLCLLIFIYGLRNIWKDMGLIPTAAAAMTLSAGILRADV